MIYSGDVDACVPYSGTEYWTSNLGFHVSDDWRPWTVDGGSRMAGYITVSITKWPDLSISLALAWGLQV